MDTFKATCSDGVSLQCYRWNAGATGVPILLHHGFTANTEINWIAPGIARRLADAGRPIVAFDARSHGASDKPTEKDLCTRARLARDVGEIADACDFAEFDYAGYSLGGIVGVIVAVQEQRLRRLALCGACHQIFIDQLNDPDHRDVAAALRADDPKAFAGNAARGFRRAADMWGGDRRALATFFEGLNTDWRLSGEAVPHIRQPTLVLAGRDDHIMIGVKRLTNVIPDVRTVWTSGDHFTAIADPAFAEALVSFFEASSLRDQMP